MSQGMFSDTLIRLEAFKRILFLRPKIDFFPSGRSRDFGQKLSNFKSAFFTCLCSYGSRYIVKLPWESFLSANNALKNTFLFNSHPEFIF